MKKILFTSFLLTGMMTVSHAGDLVVTRPGKYTSDDKKTSVEVAVSADGHINIQLDFKIHMRVPGVGENVEVTSSRNFNLPVKSGQWAFCITEVGDVWLYDGGEDFKQFRRKPDGVEQLESCIEPRLGDQAPVTLKHWIAKKAAEPGESPKLDSAVAPSK